MTPFKVEHFINQPNLRPAAEELAAFLKTHRFRAFDECPDEDIELLARLYLPHLAGAGADILRLDLSARPVPNHPVVLWRLKVRWSGAMLAEEEGTNLADVMAKGLQAMTSKALEVVVRAMAATKVLGDEGAEGHEVTLDLGLLSHQAEQLFELETGQGLTGAIAQAAQALRFHAEEEEEEASEPTDPFHTAVKVTEHRPGGVDHYILPFASIAAVRPSPDERKTSTRLYLENGREVLVSGEAGARVTQAWLRWLSSEDGFLDCSEQPREQARIVGIGEAQP